MATQITQVTDRPPARRKTPSSYVELRSVQDCTTSCWESFIHRLHVALCCCKADWSCGRVSVTVGAYNAFHTPVLSKSQLLQCFFSSCTLGFLKLTAKDITQ